MYVVGHTANTYQSGPKFLHDSQYISIKLFLMFYVYSFSPQMGNKYEMNNYL